MDPISVSQMINDISATDDLLLKSMTFIGTVQNIFDVDEDYEPGTIVCESATGNLYVKIDDMWAMISNVNDLSYEEDSVQDRIIKQTHCHHCGAPLDLSKILGNGTCQCEYCRSYISVYA